MADTSDLSRAGRTVLLDIIQQQQEEIRKLCAPELAKRDERITELQARMTEMVSTSLSRRVREFHHKFGHPVATKPKVPGVEQMSFRLKLIAEEFFELLAACEIWPKYIKDDVDVHGLVIDAIENDFIDSYAINLPEFVDAMTDLDWVVEGTRAVMGIDRRPIEDEVTRANMSKDPVYVASKDEFHRQADPAAKPTKPEGWVPPDQHRVLSEQGWKGEKK